MAASQSWLNLCKVQHLALDFIGSTIRIHEGNDDAIALQYLA